MKRSERKIYCRCIAVMAVYIVSAVWFYTTPTQAQADLIEKAVFTDDALAVEKMSTEQATVAKTGQIRENTAIRESEVASEQETGEETVLDSDSETVQVGEEMVSDPRCEIPAEVETEAERNPIYMVDGNVLDPDIQAYLYQRLADYQLEWFMPYAIMIAYQESKFDIYAVNPTNHVDCGLFQFRSYYYPGQDIFNPYEQIDIFCQQMANRSQYDVYEMISRHNVSDWGSYNEVYVGQVLAHEQNLRKVN